MNATDTLIILVNVVDSYIIITGWYVLQPIITVGGYVVDTYIIPRSIVCTI